jgi:leucyl aminopeptidase
MLRVHITGRLEGDWPLALPVRSGEPPPAFVTAAAAEGFAGKLDSVCDVHGGARRVILVGIGPAPDEAILQSAGAIAASHALRATRLSIDVRGLRKRDALACLTGAVLRAWRYEKLRTAVQPDAPRLTDLCAVTDDPKLEKAWNRRAGLLRGVEFARDLVTDPSNILMPDSFVAKLRGIATGGLTLDVLRGEALHEAGLTALLAVGGASVHPPALAILRWPGSNCAPPVAFVGKGITFDTGGISIKPAEDMWEMRADMAGAAACAGAMMALAARDTAVPVVAFLALAENAVGDNAYRPGDILRHATGTTIEVIDTDAEGRLVLADALGAAVREKPQAIIDLATLTGSVITALGHNMAGLFSNNDALAASVAAAGAAVGEPLWQLPIAEADRRALDSDIADLRHCSTERRQPDASIAAAFLREFVGDVPWAHLDIAGVENVAEAQEKRAAGATGFGVRLLDRLIRDRFEDAVPAQQAAAA